ncbi:hypothetical protein QBC45DRAFT_329945, partial [Copromyces sp. CBS 386.78]
DFYSYYNRFNYPLNSFKYYIYSKPYKKGYFFVYPVVTFYNSNTVYNTLTAFNINYIIFVVRI